MAMKWPPALVRDMASRKAIAFLGAGVSMNSVAQDGVSRPPSWYEFLKAGAKQLGRSSSKIVKEVSGLIERNDWLTACEVIKGRLGREAFVDLMRANFQDPGYRPADIHGHVWSLDLRICITPNVDVIYDGLVAERGAGTVSIKTYKDDDIAELIRSRDRLLIKSHGSVDSPNALIFTRSQYAEARSKYRPFYEMMYALLSTHTFLFIGCGLEDPDLRGLLEDYRYRNSYSRKHYFTLPKEEYHADVVSVYTESLNLEFIQYSNRDNHKELTAGLGQLTGQVDFLRQEMGRGLSW